MSSPIHFLHKKTSVNEAIVLMRKFGFRHLPILNDQENLAGLLSDRELVGAKPHSLCEELMIPKVLVGLHNARIQEIAHIMNVHVRTVDGFRKSLFSKLNIKSKTGLVMFAIKNKLV